MPVLPPGDLTTAAYFDQVLHMCERADQLGYHSVKAVEHYLHDYGVQIVSGRASPRGRR